MSVDAQITRMEEDGATQVAIDMVDKVLRPYFAILNRGQNEALDADDFVENLESLVVSMMVEYIARTVKSVDLAGAQDAAQLMINDIAEDLSSAILRNFGAPRGPTILLPH